MLKDNITWVPHLSFLVAAATAPHCPLLARRWAVSFISLWRPPQLLPTQHLWAKGFYHHFNLPPRSFLYSQLNHLNKHFSPPQYPRGGKTSELWACISPNERGRKPSCVKGRRASRAMKTEGTGDNTALFTQCFYLKRSKKCQRFRFTYLWSVMLIC